MPAVLSLSCAVLVRCLHCLRLNPKIGGQFMSEVGEKIGHNSELLGSVDWNFHRQELVCMGAHPSYNHKQPNTLTLEHHTTGV